MDFLNLFPHFNNKHFISQVSSLPKTLQSQKLYHDRMVDVAVTLGANRTSAHEELLNVVKLEFKIRDLAQTETQTMTCNLI